MNNCGPFNDPHKFKDGKCRNCGRTRQEVNEEEKIAKLEYFEAKSIEEAHRQEFGGA